jgi:hypothetical protein
MHAVVAAAALSLSPSPADVELATADIHLPYEYPALTERSPRMRAAMLLALHAADALDPDGSDANWFRPPADWAGDVRCARSVVALVRGTPTLEEGAWLPSREWFDREEALTGWAMHMDGVADGYECERWRYAAWSYRYWNKPRRVLYAELRTALGPELWAARRFPGYPE